MRLLLAAITLLIASAPADAQWLDRKTHGIPRNADGKPNLTAPTPRGPDGKPDLSGVWNGPNVVARPDPANVQPWVLERARPYQQEYFKTRPYYECLPAGINRDAMKVGDVLAIDAGPPRDGCSNANATTVVEASTGKQVFPAPAQ